MDGMIEDLVGDSILRREKRSGDAGVNSGVEAPLKQQQDREQQEQHGQGQQQEQRQGMGDGGVGLTVMLPDAPLAEPPSRRGGAGVAKAGAPGGTQEVSTNTTPTLLAKAPPGALNKSFAALTHEDVDGVQPGARPGTREPVAPAADEAFPASAAADHLSEHGSAGEPATKVGSVPIKGAQRERALQGQHRRQSSFSGFPTGATPPENPTPHVSSGSEQKQDLGEKHVLAMVGLPARGKSYMAQKLSHYLSFFHGAVVKVFNLGDYRRKLYGPEAQASFFSPDNPDGVAKRAECARCAMKDMIDFLFQESGIKGLARKNVASGRIGIFDATNSTRERRKWISDQLDGLPVKLIFVESYCDDKLTVKNNIWMSKVNNQDYKKVAEESAYRDFKRRIEQYEKVYATLEESELTWVKLINSGQRVVINNIHGFLPGRIVQFLTNIHATHKPLYLTRHGQSEYNLAGKIGGDAGLTEVGRRYAVALGRFAREEIQHGPDGEQRRTRLWTSSMQRTIQTVTHIPHPKLRDGWVQMSHRVYRQLDELYAGICDGMTYAEIEEVYPDEFKHRQEDKLAYRYPRGESYLDIISRLEPLVHEMESYREPLLIVGHQAVLRLVYAYFAGIPRDEAPRLSIPLNTVIELTPNVAGDKYAEKRTVLDPGQVGKNDGQQDPALCDPPSH